MSHGESELIFNVTTAHFQEQVLARSAKVPVAVDFWAAWCAPCRMLAPVLERAVQEMAGRVLLAKVDTDREPELARRYRISGIPAVKGFRGGQLADEFAGSRDERFVRQWLERLAPSAEAQAVEQAGELLAQGQAAAAEKLVRPLAESASPPPEALLALAEAVLAQGRLAEAAPLLDRIDARSPEAERAERLRQLLAFYLAAGDLGPAEARAVVAERPGDPEARYVLAAALAQRGEHREALEQLLELVRDHRRFRDDAARKALLLLFEHLGADSDLTQEYRRRLQVLL